MTIFLSGPHEKRGHNHVYQEAYIYLRLVGEMAEPSDPGSVFLKIPRILKKFLTYGPAGRQLNDAWPPRSLKTDRVHDFWNPC